MRYVFILSGIDVASINKQYSLSTPQNVTFLQIEDPKINVSMLNYLTKQKLTIYSGVNCFWCRHPFDTVPIGCPISYKVDVKVKDLTSFFCDNIVQIKTPTEKGWYEVDGVFCGLSCCKAFIEDNEYDPIYENSMSLLYKLYNELEHKMNKDINTAPNWRLLREYGGNMTIEEFRENIKIYTFSFHNLIRIPFYQSIGYVYDKKMRL